MINIAYGGNVTTEMTPQEYGVGARFTLSVYDSDFVRIILDALATVDADGLEIETNDISTFVTGTEQRILEYLRDVITAAADGGTHLSVALLLSRGCPGELKCELPAGVAALGAEPIALSTANVRARAHWSLYPLLDGGLGDSSEPAAVADHMDPIYRAIEEAKETGIYAGSDHYATRLDGDLSQVLETTANAWIAVGGKVQHVVSHLVISINSPTEITE